MLSASPVILVSRRPYVCLNFSNQPFDAVDVANSSLFNLSFINIAFIQHLAIWKHICAGTFLYQATRISLTEWHCPWFNFLQFPLENSYSLWRAFSFLKICETKFFPILICFATNQHPIFDFWIFVCAVDNLHLFV